MNQYHIYEAIGHGKNSTVYKGRKKKTIEYFAIKSVDKCQKSKVLQEVRILHSLSHPNVLKFYSWYETSAHLWLVLEYCVGGDLLTLLRQDSRLPEDSIHDLARDLVKALQFLHSKGIIYCDLKPSNILLDENGRMKLCDFGLSRRLSDISKNSLSQLPQGKRGTPCYMAPELFQEGGVHSYASDFWALGCVLYECYAGRPPFVGNEFTQLVNSILSDPTPPLPDNPSSSFVSLINCLLIKDPGERVQWSTLCEHSFWRTKMAHLPLPPQPAFSSMLQLFSKPCLSELNGDKPNKQKTTLEHCGRDSNGILRHDENSSISANRGIGTPIKNTQSARRTNTKGPGKVEEKQKLAANTAKRVNLLRLSRVAKTNLQREKNKDNYRQLLPKNPENDAEVKIENNDMELDFSENVEEDAQDEPENDSFVGEKTPMRAAGCEKPEKMDYNINQSDIPSENDVSVHDDSKTFEQDTSSEHVELAAASPCVNLQRKAQRAKASGGNANDPVMSKSSDDLEVFWHPSDLSVRPIMPNRKGDKALEGMPSLPFDAVPAGDYVKLSPEQLKAHNHRILLSLTGNSPSLEKQNTIKYIEMLSGSAEAAEIVTNGPIMQMLVKMLRLTKTSVLRVQLATVIGLLIRHSTFIESDLAHSGIMSALTDGLRDKQDKVRRFSMAALGELLYYISTQGENVKAGNLAESPSKDNRSASGWQVPSSLIALMSSILRKGEDDATQLYALRTIENVCSQGGDWASRFTSHGQDVIGNLCYIYKAMGKQESTRLTAGSCLVRVARFDPPSIQKIMEKLSFKDTASALIKGSSREQQISLNLLIMAMLASHMFTNIGRHLMSLVEEKLLVPSLVSLIDQGSEVLRGKALLFVALLCRSSRRWLPQFFCCARLLPAVDRLAKEKDGYVVRCLGAFVQSVSSSVPLLLETVSGDIHQMMSGKRHGPIASLSSRGNPKSSARLFPVILHLLGSSSFKHRVVSSEVLLQLANLIKLLESPFQGRDDFQITLLQILESVAEEPPIILNDPSIFTGHVLPSLAVLYKGNKDGDARFLCLKILFSLVVVLFTYMGSTSLAEEQILNDLKMMSNTYFLPLYPTFIEDEDPIPMYAQKLLVMLIEYNFINVSDILHLKTVTQCFDFLLGDLSSANVSNVKLCLALASAPDLETKILSQLHVVRKVGNLLEFVNAKQMEDFLEPTLALCKAFILRSIGGSKGIAYCKEPSLLNDSTFNVSMAFDQQHNIKDISDFGSNVGVFLELIANPERQIADLASECMVLLIKASPREATTGLLTNLPKISSALEFCQHDASGLQLLRVLHALAFSCRQFLSQAMILSISVPEIARVEAIVAGLKTSDILGVAGAASTLILELQRLPRGV